MELITDSDNELVFEASFMKEKCGDSVNVAVLNLFFCFCTVQLRYKETFERAKGHYHTVKDALDIIYHRRVTDDISEVSTWDPDGVKLTLFTVIFSCHVPSPSVQVKYREKYINSLGTWKSIPDRPEFFFSRIVNDNVSSVSPAARGGELMP